MWLTCSQLTLWNHNLSDSGSEWESNIRNNFTWLVLQQTHSENAAPLYETKLQQTLNVQHGQKEPTPKFLINPPIEIKPSQYTNNRIFIHTQQNWFLVIEPSYLLLVQAQVFLLFSLSHIFLELVKAHSKKHSCTQPTFIAKSNLIYYLRHRVHVLLIKKGFNTKESNSCVGTSTSYTQVSAVFYDTAD